MSELKTLKDLQEITSSQKVLKMELRQEAIKWIKEYQIKSKNAHIQLNAFYYDGYVDGLKEFHNITDEDLK